MQVMGPKDGYICQFSRDTKCFWASRNDLELGAGFRAQTGVRRNTTRAGGMSIGNMLPAVRARLYDCVSLGSMLPAVRARPYVCIPR